MLSVEGFLCAGPGWEAVEPWDSLLHIIRSNVLPLLLINALTNAIKGNKFCKVEASYLSADSFLAGSEELFFVSVDSRLQQNFVTQIWFSQQA